MLDFPPAVAARELLWSDMRHVLAVTVGRGGVDDRGTATT